MKYPEEDYATDLHRDLTRRFGSSSPSTTVSIKGAGVHWDCTARRADSLCSIDCGDMEGPEYFTSFERNGEEIATARIRSKEDTIAVVSDWLEGQQLSVLYERYRFVDQTKRALLRIRDDVLANAPESQQCAPQLQHQIADIYYLRFRSLDRSCEISFYGENDLPDAKCAWDECELFVFQPDDNARLAAVLKRWLCDQAQPSDMRREFPWLEIGDLADFYEDGNPIEGEFIQSWDQIEEFYREDWCVFSDSLLAMIHEMRDTGYDRLLRAGQSLSSLGLSRSRRHGLRTEQHCIWFEFHDSVMGVHADFATAGLERHPIQFTKDVQRFLDALVDFEID